MAVFQDAVQQNEPLDVYFHLVAVYERSDKLSVSTLFDCVVILMYPIVHCSWLSNCIRPW